MVLGEVARNFASGAAGNTPHPDDCGVAGTGPTIATAVEDANLEQARSPYLHVMFAGALGGTTGDMAMHSLDTVKTRQQGDPHVPSKYRGLWQTSRTIWKQEGVRRGLYSGVLPALMGSLSGTMAFFGSYEWSKRMLLDAGVSPSLAYLGGGFFADLVAAPIYVPTEVLKTRLQLQGRYNNPFFKSGYNYRSVLDAVRTIVGTEGIGALFYGLKATLYRDLPYSALQFAFWEQEQKYARRLVGKRDIGLPLEILTGASAGSMAGIVTCPLDVVKTKIQTQIAPESRLGSKRLVSTSPSTSPSTALKSHAAVTLDTSSVVTGLRLIYQTEGVGGLFRGVGPRAAWTGIQSGTMFVLYQSFLRWFDVNPLLDD